MGALAVLIGMVTVFLVGYRIGWNMAFSTVNRIMAEEEQKLMREIEKLAKADENLK